MNLVGRENVYTCPACGKSIVTVDVDEGTTPMSIACRATPGCKGMAESLMYPSGRRPPWFPTAEWEWYRPIEGTLPLTPAERNLVEQGGLLLRARTVLP